MKQTKRYIIIDRNRGVFLGTYSDEDVDELNYRSGDGKKYALFAAHNPFLITRACSFKSRGMAQSFIEDVFHHRRWEQLEPRPIETEDEYPDVIDLIKAGYGEYCHDMLEGLFDEEENPTIH